MFLSLPPSLLLLLASVLESTTVAASAPSPSPTPQAGGLGGYIASGLGANNGSSSRAYEPALPSTGTGSEYASKCAAALKTWSLSAFDWQWDNAIVTTSTFSSAFTETLQRPGTTKVTSLITLCDGHPRVVGHTSVSDGATYTSTEAWTNTITQSERNSAYPTPAPCSIQPEDCKALSKSFDKMVSEQGGASGGPPLCSTAPSTSYSYSTDNRGNTCDNCMIHASTARVMFWPVTTESNGNLCNKTASTITSSPTGPPASFVTEGITITSPTVAVSLGFMSRVDGCGTTVNHTIIPVRPEEVTSVRGFRALFTHHRFNFADLNYFCMDTNTTNSTLADGAPADSCYQQVPADAYFGGLNNAVVLDQAPFRNLSKDQMTIYNDYQPQLLPPATMTHAIASLWGDHCIIHPDGVWDPPIALTPEASLDLPSYGPGATTTNSKDQEPEKTPASPVDEFGPVSPQQTGIKGPSDGPHGGEEEGRQHFTALPESNGGDGGDGNGGGQHTSPTNGAGSGGADGSGSHGSDGNGEGGSSGSDGRGSDGSGDSAGSNGSGGGDSGNGKSDDGASNNGQSHDGNSGSNQGGAGQSHDGHSGSEEGGAGQSNGGDSSSGGSGSTGSDSDQNGGSDAAKPNGVTSVNVHTTVITVGTKSLTCSENSDGAWVVPDASTTHTISAGGSAVQVDATTVTAGPDGLVQMDASGTKGSSSDASGDDSDDASSHSDAPGTHASASKTQSPSDSQSESNRVQLTSATDSGSNAEATGTDASGTSDADSIRWSPATFALVLTAIYFSALC